MCDCGPFIVLVAILVSMGVIFTLIGFVAQRSHNRYMDWIGGVIADLEQRKREREQKDGG
jgi:NADH:ubiquinone oxidoreductase subunit 4 (subunit M)